MPSEGQKNTGGLPDFLQHYTEEDLKQMIFEALRDKARDSIYVKDRESRLMWGNNRLAWSAAQRGCPDYIGKTDAEIFVPQMARHTRTQEIQVIISGKPKEDVMGAHLVYPREEPLWTSNYKSPIFNQEHEVIGLLGITREISDLILNETEFRYASTHDSLTQLLNRCGLYEHIKQMIYKENAEFGILMIRVNGYEDLLHTQGATVAGEFLSWLGWLIKTALRANDIVGRLIEDEFVVLLDLADSMTSARKVCQKLFINFDQLLGENYREMGLTLNVGACTYPQDAMEPDLLVANAAAALEAAREKGPSTFCLYREIQRDDLPGGDR